MEIKIKGKQPYWVSFSYYTNERNGRVTTCFVSQEREEIAKGSVTCSKSDRFTKESGRKKSLTKCLDILQLTREERTEFWNQYHNRVPASNSINMDIEQLLDLLNTFYFKGVEAKDLLDDEYEIATYYIEALKEIGIEFEPIND